MQQTCNDNPIRIVLSVLAMAALAAALAGCGGISTQPPDAQRFTTVVVEVLKQGTTELVPVVAQIVVGGVRGQTDLDQGWAIIPNVPLGDRTPPEQPITVTAPGYVSVSKMITLSTYSYTPVTVDLAPADPAQTATIAGKVTDSATGRGLANALVSFEPLMGGPGVEGFTDAQGRYELGGVPAGLVLATAQALDYLEDLRDLQLQADSVGANPAVDFALVGGDTRVTVRGRVLRLGLETPVAGAQVTVADRPPTSTDAEGSFTVPEVPVGTQTVAVTAAGYDERQVTVEVVPGLAPLRLLLATSSPQPPPGPYTITGQVTLLGAADNSGAQVTALDRDSGQVMDTAATDAEGRYYLFVPPGHYRLTVTYGERSIGRDLTLLGGGRVLVGIDFTLSVP